MFRSLLLDGNPCVSMHTSRESGTVGHQQDKPKTCRWNPCKRRALSYAPVPVSLIFTSENRPSCTDLRNNRRQPILNTNFSTFRPGWQVFEILTAVNPEQLSNILPQKFRPIPLLTIWTNRLGNNYGQTDENSKVTFPNNVWPPHSGMGLTLLKFTFIFKLLR